MEKINSKALNLERLNSERNKTTLGFKCAPQLKLKLAQDAQKLRITLSEYVESIVLNYQNNSNPKVNQIAELSSKLNFYENEILKDLFTQTKGKEIEFTGVNNEKTKITVSSLQDVYTILINSFKTKKP
jgi:hypothetical protein